ncbi:MAG: cation diffusion facilitator family transporter [Bacteroidota bacterium]|nr:cation diffusion facilitator family transporter [Candidatus Kapabacteria bacterium]MDW8219298.1 cation diffusion facilitator family transporter [Bacteroidota bacterium]
MRTAPRDERIAIHLSLTAGIVMLVFKWSAYYITDSAAAFSDAIETIVHVAAVAFSAYSLHVIYRPPDNTHHFGHDKMAYFSSGIEGVLVMGAGCIIIYEAIQQWIGGLRLHDIDQGMLLLLAAASLNAILGIYLVRTGTTKRSVILIANGKHVLSDVWTSVGAALGLGMAWWTGWNILDPLIAIAFAVYIMREGFVITRRAADGLMDASNPELEALATQALRTFCSEENLSFHRFRLRESGSRIYIDFHLQFPNGVLIEEAHTLATRAERVVAQALPQSADVTSHLENAHTPEHDNVE